jgi:hypothetical protein
MKVFFNKKVIVKRASRNANNLSSYSDIGEVVGYLRALNEAESSINGVQYGRGYSFLFDEKKDIKVGDKLSLNNEIYNVQAVVNRSQDKGSLRYKKAVLTLNI